jgi:purine-binding chemotaxis protein CheW
MPEQDEAAGNADISQALLFAHNTALYAVDARAVVEILWLPELAPVVEMPPYVVGAVNYRGRALPVVDLDRRFGRPSLPYAVTHQLIVLEVADRQVGLIVQRVRDVVEVGPEDIHPSATVGGVSEFGERIISHCINRGPAVVMLLDYARLIEGLAEAGAATNDAPEPFARRLEHLPVPQREALAKRAEDLAQQVAEDVADDHIPLAVIRIGDDWFGIDVDTVGQFVWRPPLTPVPCSPSHVVGAANFEGDVLTIVDVSTALDSSLVNPTDASRVAVIRRGEFVVGALIDDVIDVVFFDRSLVRDVEGSVLAANHGFLRGVAELHGVAGHEGRLIGVLDLIGIVTQEEWIVDERVI